MRQNCTLHSGQTSRVLSDTRKNKTKSKFFETLCINITSFAELDIKLWLREDSDLGPVHMIPGQLFAPGQLTDPGVNFASVDGLTPVTVHSEFFVAPGQLREVGYPLYNTG